MGRFKVSRLFIGTLAGVAMTLLGWFGPWEWPVSPAFTVMRLAFGSVNPYEDLTYAGQAALLVGLIVVNVGFWALIVWCALALSNRANRVART